MPLAINRRIDVIIEYINEGKKEEAISLLEGMKVKETTFAQDKGSTDEEEFEDF